MKLVTTLAVATLFSASAMASALATDVEGLTLEQRNVYLYTPDGPLRTVRQQALHNTQPRAHSAAESFARAPAEPAAPAYDRLTATSRTTDRSRWTKGGSPSGGPLFHVSMCPR